MAVIEAIATTYLEADAASVTFSSIPSTFEHLQLRCSGRTDYDTTNAYDNVHLRLNSDSTTTYVRHYMYGGQSSTGSGGSLSQTGSVNILFASDSTPATAYGPNTVDILDYANGYKFTTIRTTSTNGYLNVTQSYVMFGSTLWRSTTAVNAVTLTSFSGSNFRRGSEFTLYGLKST